MRTFVGIAIFSLLLLLFAGCGSSTNSASAGGSGTPGSSSNPGGSGGSGGSGSGSGGSGGSGSGSGGSGGSGSGSGGSGSGAVFAYVFNTNDLVSGTLSINTFTTQSNGALTPVANGQVSAPAGNGAGMTRIGNTLWIAIGLPNELVSYSIDSSTGSLKQLAITPTPSSGRLVNNGQFLLEAQLDGKIGVYSVDGSSGAATPAPGSPYSTGGALWSVTANSSTLYAAVGTTTGDVIQEFSIASDGSLTPVGTAVPVGAPLGNSPGRNPQGTTIYLDPSGGFLWAANQVDNSIRSFALGSGGTPTLVSKANVSDIPWQLTSDATYLYVSSYGTGVYSFSMNSSGMLTPISSEQDPDSPSYDAEFHGGVLYVVGQAGVSAWSTSSGALTPLAGTPFAAPGESSGNPTFIAFSL